VKGEEQKEKNGKKCPVRHVILVENEIRYDKVPRQRRNVNNPVQAKPERAGRNAGEKTKKTL